MVNGRAAVICIVTERILWMIQRGEDGAAVDKCATPQVSALSGTARGQANIVCAIIGSNPALSNQKMQSTLSAAIFLVASKPKAWYVIRISGM